MSDPENFRRAMVAAEARHGEGDQRQTAADAATTSRRSRRRAESGGRAACASGESDGACLRSGEPAVNRIHYGRQRHPRLSAKGVPAELTKAALRRVWTSRSRDSRFYRALPRTSGTSPIRPPCRVSVRSKPPTTFANSLPRLWGNSAGTRSERGSYGSVRSRYRFHICCEQRSVSRGPLASNWHASRKQAGGARRSAASSIEVQTSQLMLRRSMTKSQHKMGAPPSRRTHGRALPQ